MKSNYLTIGQMADLNHISSQTLRLYDKKGLLSPAYYDPENGYRYYHILQCEHLDLINTMKICGMSLKQIKEQLHHTSYDDLFFMLKQQEKRLESEIASMKGSLSTVRRFADNIRRLNNISTLDHVVYEYIPERRIETFESNIDFFQSGFFGYELMLREFKSYMIKNSLPLSYFFSAGTIMDENNFINGEYKANKVFIFVDDNYPSSPSVTTLPQNLYMTIYAEDISKEHIYAKKLMSEITMAGFRPCGDYLCEPISHISYGEEDKRFLTYRIQVPVSR